MNPKTKRKSNVVLGLAVGFLAVVVVVLVGIGRIAFSHMDTAVASDIPAIDFSNTATQNFPLENFRSISFIGSWEVDLEQGDNWQVELTYPRALERSIRVALEGDKLVLDPGSKGRHRWNWNWWGGGKNQQRFTARIVMPELEAIEISGASDMDLSGFEGDKLDITISGAGNIEGDDGYYKELTLIMSGAGNVEMRDMTFVDAQVVLSGAGNVELGMDGGVLSGNLSGFGNIEYYGTVSDETVRISGFGKVRQRD